MRNTNKNHIKQNKKQQKENTKKYIKNKSKKTVFLSLVKI